jgi:hypothetical protein
VKNVSVAAAVRSPQPAVAAAKRVHVMCLMYTIFGENISVCVISEGLLKLDLLSFWFRCALGGDHAIQIALY